MIRPSSYISFKEKFVALIWKKSDLEKSFIVVIVNMHPKTFFFQTIVKFIIFLK